MIMYCAHTMRTDESAHFGHKTDSRLSTKRFSVNDNNNNNISANNNLNLKDKRFSLANDTGRRSHLKSFNSDEQENDEHTFLPSSNTSLLNSDRSSLESSLIRVHKYLKDHEIYNSNYKNQEQTFKKRTIVLIKSKTKSTSTVILQSQSSSALSFTSLNSSSSSSSNNNNVNIFSSSKHLSNKPSSSFGFNLQSYGLLNPASMQVEYICFVNNVQPDSPAKKAGLENGDVILSIDDKSIEEFKNLKEIHEHVKDKTELRLVVITENICKKIKIQQRIEKVKSLLNAKYEEMNRLNKLEQELLIKYKLDAETIYKNSIANAQPTEEKTTATNRHSSLSMSSSSNGSTGSSRKQQHRSLKSSFTIQNISNNSNNQSERSSKSSRGSLAAEDLTDCVSTTMNSRVETNNMQPDTFISTESKSITPNSFKIRKTSNLITAKDNMSNNSNQYHQQQHQPTVTVSSNNKETRESKARSFAQRFIFANRIVRSASSSSMNLLSNFRFGSSSNNNNNNNVPGSSKEARKASLSGKKRLFSTSRAFNDSPALISSTKYNENFFFNSIEVVDAKTQNTNDNKISRSFMSNENDSNNNNKSSSSMISNEAEMKLNRVLNTINHSPLSTGEFDDSHLSDNSSRCKSTMESKSSVSSLFLSPNSSDTSDMFIVDINVDTFGTNNSDANQQLNPLDQASEDKENVAHSYELVKDEDQINERQANGFLVPLELSNSFEHEYFVTRL